MGRPSAQVVTAVCGVVAGAAAMLALTVGTGPAMPVLLLVALITGAIAVWSWQATQPVRTEAGGRSWWKFLLAGPAVAALTFAAMAVPWPDAIDLGDMAYWLIVIAFMTSITLVAAGVLLGMVAVVERRGTRPVGT